MAERTTGLPRTTSRTPDRQMAAADGPDNRQTFATGGGLSHLSSLGERSRWREGLLPWNDVRGCSATPGWGGAFTLSPTVRLAARRTVMTCATPCDQKEEWGRTARHPDAGVVRWQTAAGHCQRYHRTGRCGHVALSGFAACRRRDCAVPDAPASPSPVTAVTCHPHWYRFGRVSDARQPTHPAPVVFRQTSHKPRQGRSPPYPPERRSDRARNAARPRYRPPAGPWQERRTKPQPGG